MLSWVRYQAMFIHLMHGREGRAPGHSRCSAKHEHVSLQHRTKNYSGAVVFRFTNPLRHPNWDRENLLTLANDEDSVDLGSHHIEPCRRR